MATDRIEIRPGVFIDVTQRVKQRAGIARAARIQTRLTDHEHRQALRDIGRHENPNVKYSTLLLNEAVEASRKLGVRKAAKITGVKYWSIVQRKRELSAQGKYTPRAKPNSYTRYSMALKKRCVVTARNLMAKGMGQRAAFISAGKQMGCNGRSIEWQYTQNSIR